MDREAALAAIQQMHKARTVTNHSVVAWYRVYSHKLPKMHPERSDVDLMLTISLWMELTDRGGEPGFPFDYRSALKFPTINPTKPFKVGLAWQIGSGGILTGLVLLLFSWKIALILMIGGLAIIYTGYRAAGGPTCPDLMHETSGLYQQEGKRVLQWASDHKDVQRGALGGSP